MRYEDRTSLNGDLLVRSSRLAARVDNNAIADGFQLYLHGFIVTSSGEWAIVQQGMNGHSGIARRYRAVRGGDLCKMTILEGSFETRLGFAT